MEHVNWHYWGTSGTGPQDELPNKGIGRARMTVSDLLARTLLSDQFLGLSINTGIAAVAAALREGYAEELHSRRDQRVLRRDYGLAEVTFDGGPDWVIRWILVEIHRLALLNETIALSADLYGLQFTPFVAWVDVQDALKRHSNESVLELDDDQGGYRVFRIPGRRSIIRVVNDPTMNRGDFPGIGDVWSLEIV